jgi:hypothetical protein
MNAAAMRAKNFFINRINLYLLLAIAGHLNLSTGSASPRSNIKPAIIRSSPKNIRLRRRFTVCDGHLSTCDASYSTCDGGNRAAKPDIQVATPVSRPATGIIGLATPVFRVATPYNPLATAQIGLRRPFSHLRRELSPLRRAKPIDFGTNPGLPCLTSGRYSLPSLFDHKLYLTG